MSAQQKAQALIIQCIDLRFQQTIDLDISAKNLTGKFDRISWPGASKDLTNVKAACQVSLRLHDPDEILIYEHEDCGAYGTDNSLETHKANAQKLAEKLKTIKPSLTISILTATFGGIKDL